MVKTGAMGAGESTSKSLTVMPTDNSVLFPETMPMDYPATIDKQVAVAIWPLPTILPFATMQVACQKYIQDTLIVLNAIINTKAWTWIQKSMLA